jgi:hypothetical protein
MGTFLPLTSAPGFCFNREPGTGTDSETGFQKEEETLTVGFCGMSRSGGGGSGIPRTGNSCGAYKAAEAGSGSE